MKNKFYTNHIGIYMAIVGFSILLLVPIYISIYRGAEERISANTYNNLKESISKMDAYLENVSVSVDIFYENEYVRILSDIQGKTSAKDAYAILKAKEALKSLYMLRVEEFEEYLIFKNNDIVINTVGVLSNPMIQNYENVGQNGTDYRDFVQWAFEGRQQSKYTTCIKNDNTSGIIGIVRAMEAVGKYSDVAWVFQIDKNLLNKYLGIETDSADFAYITDRYGNLLYHVNCPEALLEELSMDADVLSDEAAANEQKVKYNGKRYNVFHRESLYSGWNWNIAIEHSKIQEEISDVNRLIVLYIVFAVIGICVVSAFAVWRNIRKEGYFIENIENLKESIQASTLAKLFLCGICSQKEMGDIQDYLQYDMEFYCVVCITTNLESEQDILSQYAYVDEFMNEKFQCVGLNIGKVERNYIIHMDKQGTPDTEGVLAQMTPLLSNVPEIRIGISSIGTEIENIQTCYQQAKMMNRQTTEEYRIRSNEYYLEGEGNSKRYRLTMNLGNKIYDLIYAGEKETLQALFDKIYSFAKRETWRTETEIMQFFFDIQSPVARVCDEIQVNNPYISDMLCYRSEKTIVELASMVEEVSLYLCDHVNEKLNIRSKKENRYNMIQFMEENFTNKDMSASFAAQHMGISEKYFAALFKEQTGKSFGIYLESKRMNAAEKLLLETELSVAQIAEEVGYNTLDAFYKAFKKNYGIAPGQWRSIRAVDVQMDEQHD